MTRPRRPALVLTTVLLAGCAGDSTERSAEPVVRDSAGVRIVENRFAMRDPAPGWRVGPEPVLQVGSMDGDTTSALHRVVGAVRLSDGGIVVASAGSRDLRWFDAAGRHIGTAGRAGDGPGEFRAPGWIGPTAGDTVQVWDRQHRRVSTFHAARFIREAPARLPADRALPSAMGRLAGGSLLVVPGPVHIPEERPGVQRPPMPVWVVAPGDGAARELGPFPGTAVELRPAATPGAWIRTEVPLGPRTLVAAVGDLIAVGDNAQYEIRLYSAGGDLAEIIRRDVAPTAIGPRDLEAELEARLDELPAVEQIRDGVRAAFIAVTPPDRLPFFRELMAGPTGHLWLRRDVSRAVAGPRWDVFDPHGRWLGEVATPAGLRVTEIGADFIVGVWTDAHDVEYVRVYDLEQSKEVRH
jgi:hypothetical protein